MAYEQLVSVPSSATSGQVPKANGSGGYTWETPKAYYEKPSGGIPAADLASGVQTNLGLAATAYQKPSGGIPSTDLAESYAAATHASTHATGGTDEITPADIGIEEITNAEIDALFT